MKMIINRKLWVLGLLIPMFISCSEEESAPSVVQGFEQIDFFSSTSVTPITVGEGGTFSFELPAIGDKQIVPVHFNVAGGPSSTATEGVDYTIDTDYIEVAAFGNAVVTITVLPDLAAEGNETIYFTLTGDEDDIVGVAGEVEVLALTVRDSIYTTPGLNLGWQGEIAPFPGNFWCDFLDVDMLIFDGAGNEVSGYAGATGNCGETITAADLPDGTFTIEANLWANPITGNGLNTEILPIICNVALGGVGFFQFNANDIGLTPVWTGDTPSDQAGANNITMGTITVDGNIMTLHDGNGTLVGSVGSN